ncbi:MAG: MotA/TolQ/ExbB proton channel family protein [Myxococcota bacterium]|nr:MotA/TolQ/ExbB proton channel family protein [Myxococcota bacterium]
MLWDLLTRGGVLIYPIGLCSLVTVAVFIERLWHLQKSRIIPETFTKRIESLIVDGRVSDALLLCQESSNPMANVFSAALSQKSLQRAEIKELVEETGKYEAAQLEKYIEILGTCAAITPLLGLLGTVIGMMSVFQQVEVNGLGDPSLFASGIWQALITTAVGISVAIPAYIFYKYLQGRVDLLLLEMEERALKLIDKVCAHP